MGKRDRAVFEHWCTNPSQRLAWRIFAFFFVPQSKAYGGNSSAFRTRFWNADPLVCSSMSPSFVGLWPGDFS